jgi:hypothetical protein
MLDRLLFESPALSAGGALIVLVIAGLLVNRQGKAKAAGAIFALAVLVPAGLVASSLLVETDRERIAARTIALIDAAAEGRPDDVRGFVSDRLVVSASGEGVVDLGPTMFVWAANTASRQVESHSASLQGAAVEGEGLGRSRWRIRAMTGRGPFLASGEFTWIEEGDGVWRVQAFDLRTVNGQDASPKWFGNIRP